MVDPMGPSHLSGQRGIKSWHRGFACPVACVWSSCHLWDHSGAAGDVGLSELRPPITQGKTGPGTNRGKREV